MYTLVMHPNALVFVPLDTTPQSQGLLAFGECILLQIFPPLLSQAAPAQSREVCNCFVYVVVIGLASTTLGASKRWLLSIKTFKLFSGIESV